MPAASKSALHPMLKSMLIAALLLGIFAVVGSGMVATTHEFTAERIARNEREALLANLHALVPPGAHSNDLYEDRITVNDPELLGTWRDVEAFRARKDGEPVAVVLNPEAPEGYGGSIKLLVAIRYDGRIAGVRVITHHETPGLGDKIEAQRSDWIRAFEERSLLDPPPPAWKVKKDGGIFDQFTGATITPRAVVAGVYNTLRYFHAHRDALFAPASAAATQEETP